MNGIDDPHADDLDALDDGLNFARGLFWAVVITGVCVAAVVAWVW